MKNDRFGIGIIGCGNISEHYASTMAPFSQLELVGFTDLDRSRAEALAQRFGGKVFESMEEMIQSDEIDIVVNLTIHHAHYDVTRACLGAGKHVYSEKPLALTREEGFELVEFTRKQGVRLACAPAVHLGDIQETAWRFLETGALGKVRLVFAEVNQGRIETWHPAPEPIYQVGPILDIGVYAITLTTAMFGPIQRVRAFSTTIMPERQTKEGRKFTLDSPDFYQIIFEMRNGIIFRLNANYYADMGEKQSGYEVHGDLGSLYLSSWHNYDGTVEFRPYGDRVNYQPVPLIRPAFIGPKRVELCRGLDSFASSIRYDKPQLVQGAHAAHVLDASLAAHESARIQAPVEVKSTFIQPSLSLIEDLA